MMNILIRNVVQCKSEFLYIREKLVNYPPRNGLYTDACFVLCILSSRLYKDPLLMISLNRLKFKFPLESTVRQLLMKRQQSEVDN